MNENQQLITKTSPDLSKDVRFFKKNLIIGATATAVLSIVNIALLATDQINYHDSEHTAADNVFIVTMLSNLCSVGYTIFSSKRMHASQIAEENYNQINTPKLTL